GTAGPGGGAVAKWRHCEPEWGVCWRARSRRWTSAHEHRARHQRAGGAHAAVAKARCCPAHCKSCPDRWTEFCPSTRQVAVVANWPNSTSGKLLDTTWREAARRAIVNWPERISSRMDRGVCPSNEET